MASSVPSSQLTPSPLAPLPGPVWKTPDRAKLGPKAKVARGERNLSLNATHLLYSNYKKQQLRLQRYMKDPGSKQIGLARDIMPIAKPKSVVLLGKGTCSQVRQVYDLFLHGHIALKCSTGEYASALTNEARLLYRLNRANCPNIVQVLYLLRIRDELAIAMRLEAPSVESHLTQILPKHSFSLPDTLTVARDMLEALKGLDRESVIHGDVAPKNIAYDERKRRATLLDFGLSIRKTDRPQPEPEDFQTPGYRAPEVILKKEYTPEVDVWSLGIVLYSMYTGANFFYFSDDIMKDSEREIELLHQMFAICGPPSLDFVRSGVRADKYCSVNPKDGRVQLKQKTSPFIENRVRRLQKDPDYFDKRFVRAAESKGENPEQARKLWQFIRTLVSYERPTAAEAEVILNNLFGDIK